MRSKQPAQLKISIGLSLAVSLSLVLLPFTFPSIPIGPFMLANWALMMVVGWLALPRFNWRRPFQKPDRDKGRLFAFVLIAFTVAGYVAIYNAESMVRANDLEELRAGVFARPN